MKTYAGTVKADTFEMDYFCFGSGEAPFVILPGLSVQSVMGAADAVAAEYELLAKDYRVYVFDRRSALPPEYSIREMAADTAKAMQILGLGDVCLFGASQGGMIAMVIAAEYPQLVKKLILGSTSSHVREKDYKAVENWIRLAQKKDPEGLYLSFGKAIYPPEVFEQFKDALIAAAGAVTDRDLERFILLAGALRGFDFTAELGKISCPVLAIGVFEDEVLDSDATMEIAENLDWRDDFRLYMYIGYGHAAFDTAPDYRERILAFLRQ